MYLGLNAHRASNSEVNTYIWRKSKQQYDTSEKVRERLPPNKRLQLTAFGARDRVHFEAIVCRAPRRQLKRNPFGRWGTWSAIPRFVNRSSQKRTPVVPVSGVPAPVVLTWDERPSCGVPVVPRVIVCWAWFNRTPVVPGMIPCGGGSHMRVAARNDEPAAEPAHAADRCARAIVGILTVCAVRSRRLMGTPLGHRHQSILAFKPSVIY
jgi:hypothetical protein